MSSEYVRSLRDEDMTDEERLAVAILVSVFLRVESSGSCFDVLVRRAIEEAEAA